MLNKREILEEQVQMIQRATKNAVDRPGEFASVANLSNALVSTFYMLDECDEPKAAVENVSYGEKSFRYRKRPVEVEAFQYDGDMIFSNGTPYVPEWAIQALDAGTMYYTGPGELYIRTLEGEMHVSLGDFIIRGVKGEFYPCKPDVFAQTYEPVR